MHTNPITIVATGRTSEQVSPPLTFYTQDHGPLGAALDWEVIICRSSWTRLLPRQPIKRNTYRHPALTVALVHTSPHYVRGISSPVEVFSENIHDPVFVLVDPLFPL
jgi:hypothetical protein